MQLDLFGFVGMIMLVGLVKKNAIMMIDFALDAQRTESKSAADAIFEGCIIRFRPIMMTTMAALMGTLPIAIGSGDRRGIAPPARRCGRRRAVLLAVPDPLHHAGGLHLYGFGPAMDGGMAERRRSASGGAARIDRERWRRKAAGYGRPGKGDRGRRAASSPPRRIVARQSVLFSLFEEK